MDNNGVIDMEEMCVIIETLDSIEGVKPGELHYWPKCNIEKCLKVWSGTTRMGTHKPLQAQGSAPRRFSKWAGQVATSKFLLVFPKWSNGKNPFSTFHEKSLTFSRLLTRTMMGSWTWRSSWKAMLGKISLARLLNNQIKKQITFYFHLSVCNV